MPSTGLTRGRLRSIPISRSIDGMTRSIALRTWRDIWGDANSKSDSEAAIPINSCARLQKTGRLLLWMLAQVPRVVRGRIVMAKSFILGRRRKALYLDEHGALIDYSLIRQSLVPSPRKSFHRRPIDVPGVLIRAKIPHKEILPNFDATFGWGDLFPRGLELLPMSGDH